MRRVAAVLVVGLACVACSTDETPDAGSTPSASITAPGSSLSPTPSESTSQSPSQEPAPPATFEASRATQTVRVLAGRIGPREATTRSYAKAADWVDDRFTALGYDVARQWFRVPAGNSWGVDVPAGRTSNVIATSASYQEGQRYLIVGAHLDTVPQAPGAEDNASGTSVLLELARVAATEQTRLPVVLIAFGAEEPRGSGDDWHHFGSQAYTAQMSRSERRSLAAMVSLDRVGVGATVPICGGGLTDEPVVRELRQAARQAKVPFSSCGVNQSSDHWSFERAGLPAARLGSTTYDEYHDESDLPSVVQQRQLQRSGEVMWAFLAQGRNEP